MTHITLRDAKSRYYQADIKCKYEAQENKTPSVHLVNHARNETSHLFDAHETQSLCDQAKFTPK